VEHITIESTPRLRSPTMIAAFQGWNDAGGAASLATDAERFAVVDPDPFIDYQQTRPTVTLLDGQVRKVEWPETEILASEDADIVIVLGPEPNMRWRAYSDSICQLAAQIGVELVVTLGALLADTPHTRPVPVSSTASDEELIARLALTRSNYEGPTGIVGVLHDACGRAGLRSASLWAATPHYISATPNPRAAVALLERLAELVGTPGPSGELVRAASDYAVRVAAAVSEDPELAGYVEQLESAADAEDPPTGEDLARDFERYLREQGSEEEGG
jgi:predicted ATP-grasp superfamily ATP-dependent carboligase